MKPADFWRLCLFLAIGAAFGALFQQSLIGIILSLLTYIWTVHYNLTTLAQWVSGANAVQGPEKSGIFEELNYSINKLFRRHKTRRERLTGVLRQFEEATKAWPDAIVVLNQMDDIEWANPAARNLLDIRWPEDKKQRVTNIVRFPALREFINSPEIAKKQTIEIISPLKPDIYLSALMVPYSETHRILTTRDVTEIYRAIKARSDFVANVSHELKTPLTVFRGYLEALGMQKDVCPPTWEPAIKQMREHAIEMSDLVDTLLKLSHLEESQILLDDKPINMKALLEEVISATKQIYEEKNHIINLDVEASENLMGSKRELYSAFSNLTLNAAHYTPANGTISLRWHKEGSDLVLDVKDTGIGIAEEHLPRITERFYRVDSSRTRAKQGSKNGLGLAIVKHVVRRHNASLNISSEVGKGSCFSVKFKK